MNKKIVDKRLNDWYEQISSFKKLKFSEAKELYTKAMNTENEEMRKKYLDEVITGTLYVVYEYIIRNDIDIFTSSSYDIDDIINTLNEVWTRYINDGELLKVDNYSMIFHNKFFTEVNDILFADDVYYHGLSKQKLVECISRYIKYMNNPMKGSFKEHLMDKLMNKTIDYDIYRLCILYMPFFDRIYRKISNNGERDISIDKNKIANFLKLLIDMGITEPLHNDLVSSDVLIDNVEEKIEREEFIKRVDELLTNDRTRKIIHDRFGIDGEPMTLEQIAKKNDITRERIRTIEDKALRSLRIDGVIREIGKNRFRF